MKKLYLTALLLSLLFLVNVQMVKAEVAPVDVSEPQDVGNKICPVMGEKIDEKTKTTYEYEGKVYNFCCPMCISEFKKNPERYIEVIDKEKEQR